MRGPVATTDRMIDHLDPPTLAAEPEAFDELFVVAGLHLGGRRFDAGEALAAMIRELGARAAPRLALVIAGELFDLPPGAGPEDFASVAATPACAPVFAALAEFARTPGRRLALVLGSDDRELATAPTRRWLSKTLAADAGRVELAFGGWGYAARVGERRVLVAHGGDEAEPGTAVDFEQLRARNLAEARGSSALASEPLAGLELRALVHARAARHPLLALLGPATPALAPVLAALDPEDTGPLLAALRALDLRRSASAARAHASGSRLLGAAASEPSDASLHERYLAPTLRDDPIVSNDDAAALLWSAKVAIASGRDPRARARAGMLGAWDRSAGASSPRQRRSHGQNQARPVDGPQALARALSRWVEAAGGFELDGDDPSLAALDRLVGPSVDVLIAGHGGRPRACLRARAPGRAYFNPGGWSRALRPRVEALRDPAARERLWRAATAGSLAALEDPDLATLADLGGLPGVCEGEDLRGLVVHAATLVGVHPDHALLYRARPGGELEPLPDTRLPRA
ncbi:hypothetical protein G6O69_09630 [Pseudenhygromyxa sp. WMMC2535]|uniref:hypothetical protein n=1 Tax=Pseudenhygromyxa sp. WMMC2535 TaxID=2712867 RepID=UPI001595BA42|nr:hypothetical protein [Pseudenhygromyxa sp. WMMC2535]NVB38091.1 hypothetical protein [Pseudenhygromyxa sp. WMMC2535]